MNNVPTPALFLLPMIYLLGGVWVITTCTVGFLLHYKVLEPSKKWFVFSSPKHAIATSVLSAAALWVFGEVLETFEVI